MAKIIRSLKPPVFEPFQIVIDIDSREKAMVYGKFFSDPSRMAQLIANMLYRPDFGFSEIQQILDAEMSAEQWLDTFEKYMP